MMPSKKPVKKSETITATTANKKLYFRKLPRGSFFFISTEKDRVSPVSFFSLSADEGVQQLQRIPIFHCHGVSTSPPKVLITSAYT